MGVYEGNDVEDVLKKCVSEWKCLMLVVYYCGCSNVVFPNDV